jgi:hypothetical protein
MIINTNVMDDVRVAAGLLTIDEVLALCSSNTIFDPFSVLISRKVEIGAGNILYPVTSLLSDGSATLTIGNDNTFHSARLFPRLAGISLSPIKTSSAKAALRQRQIERVHAF